MKNTFFILTCLIHLNIYGQDLPITRIPSSFRVFSGINISRYLFNTSDLKNIRCKNIKGCAINFDSNLNKVDTVFTFNFVFDDFFLCKFTRIFERNRSKLTDIKYEQQVSLSDSIFYETTNCFEIMKKDTVKTFEQTTTYKNKLIIKNIEKQYFIQQKSKYYGHEDHYLYSASDNNVIKSEKYYEITTGNLVFEDSILEKKIYDNKGRLIEASRIPSKYFFNKNTGNNDYGEHFIFHVEFKYFDALDSCIVKFYDPLKGSFNLIFEYSVKKVYSDSTFQVYKYKLGDKVYSYLKQKQLNSTIEAKEEEIKITNFLEKTNLPTSIKYITNNSTLIYNFTYIK